MQDVDSTIEHNLRYFIYYFIITKHLIQIRQRNFIMTYISIIDKHKLDKYNFKMHCKRIR